jgi:argininosuccinate lyase
VAICSVRECELEDLTDDDLKTVSEHLDPSVRQVLSVESALASRTTPGSTGPGPVADQLAQVQHNLDTWRQWAVEKVVPR